ncbi:MAG: exo-alpha-sialidase, partial [candidate division WOR-3 bacterium]
MRGAIVLAVAVLVLPAFGRPDPPRGWLVVRDTFPRFRGVSDSVVVARDITPGTGIFEYCVGPTGFHGPLADVDSSGCMPVVLADTSDSIMYFSRVDPWCQWDDPVPIATPLPDPCCPSYNVAVSRVSSNVCITWVYSPRGHSQRPGFYRTSTDGGVTWGPSTELVWPDAYGGDTLTSFHSSSLFPFYDEDDGLHIAASVGPYLNDTNFVLPAQIWHWKNDTWSLVHQADPESLRAPVGYNSLVAGRPSLGGSPRFPDALLCAWEEFDGYNVDTLTGLLRADIWVAFSDDNGETWVFHRRLTGPGVRASHRFPCICDLAIEGSRLDTNMVVYLVDQQAGFACLGQGSATQNPVAVCKFFDSHPATDTIGGTTQDLQCLGPAVRTLCNSEDYGVHAAWEHSLDLSGGGFPYLNTRYNFYDYSTGWNWIDPDYLFSGVNVFTGRTAMGRLSADSNTGSAHVSGHYVPQTWMSERKPESATIEVLLRAPTVVRGSLILATNFSPRGCGLVLLDAAGRKVMDLKQGKSDIRHLAPGVY